MRRIPLTKGQYAIVDDTLYPILNRWKWHALKHRNTYYAISTQRLGCIRKNFRMHRLVMGVRKGQQVDRINGLDNRKANLRLCNNTQNRANQIKRKNRLSRFKGVTWARWAKKWRARIQYRGKYYHLGYFSSEEDAHLAYKKAAKKYFGEYARFE